jgi:hypothetical protein
MMQFRAALVATIVGAAMLAGCGGEDEAQRKAVVDQRVRECMGVFNKDGGGAAAAAVGIDVQRVCNCAVGKMVEGKSIEDIRAADTQSQPSQADIEAASSCMVEEAQRKLTGAK